MNWRLADRFRVVSGWNDGVTAVEFAIVFPIALILTVGTLEVSWKIFEIVQVIESANVVAREVLWAEGGANTLDSLRESWLEVLTERDWFTLDPERMIIQTGAGAGIDGFVEVSFRYDLESLLSDGWGLTDLVWNDFSYSVTVPSGEE